MSEAYPDVRDALNLSVGREHELAAILVDGLPIDGASVSTIGTFLGAETVSASDPIAARIDEIQFDLGEGPCWDAMHGARPVLIPDIRAPILGARWPAFTSSISDVSVTSLFAFPLAVGPLKIGAIDLYSQSPVTMTDDDAKRVLALSRIVSRLVLGRALTRAGGYDPSDDGGPFSRRIVHQATGVVLAQLDMTPEEARLVIEGHAFATDRPVREIAEAIVNGDLDFSRQSSGIEESDD